MSQIQRFEPWPQEWPLEDNDGSFVLYEDHIKAVEELEAKLDDKEAECRHLRGCVNVLEAKLAKAVDLLRRAGQQIVWESLGLGNTFAEEVEATLAELTRGKDD